MKHKRPFSKDIILLENIEEIISSIVTNLRADVLQNMKRNGAVIGISGGIDSSVCLALAVKTFGPEKVLAIMMPEKDSSPDSEKLAQVLADKFRVKTIKEDITPALSGFGCYKRRDEAVKRIFPEYDPYTYKMKIGIKHSGLSNFLPPIFYITIIDDKGNIREEMIPVKEYLKIVAASNFKQRSRMSMLYFYAESMYYAVIGTPNKHEVEQGFFVKYGDGGADIMPIAHLYKTQVYQLARYLEIPQEIIDRTPTSDTYSAEQTQEEFFFQLPFNKMDLFWYAFENKYLPAEVATVMEKTTEEVENIFMGFERKIKTTEYLRMAPVRFHFNEMKE